jgi:hypothetical protein
LEKKKQKNFFRLAPGGWEGRHPNGWRFLLLSGENGLTRSGGSFMRHTMNTTPVSNPFTGLKGALAGLMSGGWMGLLLSLLFRRRIAPMLAALESLFAQWQAGTLVPLAVSVPLPAVPARAVARTPVASRQALAPRARCRLRAAGRSSRLLRRQFGPQPGAPQLRRMGSRQPCPPHRRRVAATDVAKMPLARLALARPNYYDIEINSRHQMDKSFFASFFSKKEDSSCHSAFGSER